MCKFLFFILFPVFVFAQDVTFQLEKSILFEDDYKETEIVLAEKFDQSNFIILRSFKSGVSTKSGFYLEKYNISLKKISEFEFNIEHPRYEKYSVVLGAFFSQSKVYILEMFYDLKSKNYVCQANIIDENYKVVKKELFHLSKDEVKGFGLQSLFYNADKINLNNLGLFEQEKESIWNEVFSNPFKNKTSVSDNKSSSELVLKVNKGKTLFSIAMTFEYDNESLMKLFLFDTNLNKKIEKDFVSEEGQVINKNIELHDSLEEIYLTQKVYSDDLKNKKEGGKYFYEIKKVTPNDLQTQKIEVENHYLPALTVFYNESNLYGIGFYSDVKDLKYSGISYFKINSENLELKSAKYNLFNEQFILDKYGKLKDKEFRYMVVKNVFWNSNNDLSINAEEVYSVAANSSTSIGINKNDTYYNYDDIIAINLDSNGELIAARNINKKQAVYKSQDKSYVSYTSLMLNDKNYFFINTREKIGELSNDRIEFEGTRKNNSYLNVISVNKNGDFNFKEIVNKEDTEVPFMVSKGIVIDNSVIFLGQKGKNKQLLKVTL
jgi:hypothetical protein